MTVTRRSIALAVTVCLVAIPPALAQTGGEALVKTPLSIEEMERFLTNAEIVASKSSKKGVTNAKQITLFDGRLRHDAQLQDVDIAMPLFDVGPKHSEVNFKDTYRYNIAGYHLAVLLGLDNVPMSVERRVNGKPAAITWWIDDVMMDEGGRQKKKTVGPNPSRTASQLHVMRVFDELIQNRDRNAGNLLWTADWKMWMIDHTRAFRLGKELLKPQSLDRCERTLFEKMKELTFERISEVTKKSLTREEIEAVLARRDLIVKIFEERIAVRGENVVLFTMAS